MTVLAYPKNPHRDFPANPEAERALVGALMMSRGAVDDARRVVSSADFAERGSAVHSLIFDAACALVDRGVLPDPTTVAEETGLDRKDLVAILSDACVPASVLHYARIVAENAAKRRLLGVAMGVEEYAKTLPAPDAIDRSRALLETVSLPARDDAHVPDLEEFLGVEDVPPDFLVPGLIERLDRVLLVAGEGAGKSTMVRQAAVMGAAGLHFLTEHFITPFTSLIIDLESSEHMVRRKIRALHIQASRHKTYDPSRVKVACRPEGIDLTTRADTVWLTELIASSSPDLVCFGPLYKSYTGDMGEEDNARHVAGLIDKLRSRFQTTWMIETHAPHGSQHGRTLRPFGSSLWLRWPEQGISLRADEDDDSSAWVGMFRGLRDERDWPRRLRKGGKWPWSDYDSSGF